MAACSFAVFSQDAGDRPFDTRLEAGFGDATVPLRALLRSRRLGTSKTQHFCVVGYRSATDKRAWVYWREGGQIILWRGAANPDGAETAIARSRRVTDLNKDVVPTEADVKGSTYLVTRAWVDRLLADCQARGEKYAVDVSRK